MLCRLFVTRIMTIGMDRAPSFKSKSHETYLIFRNFVDSTSIL